MTSRSFAAICLTLCACSGTGTAFLTRVTVVQTSTKCASGGFTIATGPDTSGNGTLEDSEVKDSTEICTSSGSTGPAGADGPQGPQGATGDAGINGTQGFNSLTQSSAVAVGSTQCPQGGVRIEFGLDDGAGGGTARNGTLETGEILSTRYVCNGGMPYYPGTTTAPATPAGAFKIDTSGGTGTALNGGRGGTISVQISNGSLGGNVKVFRTGVADASFTVPAAPAFVPGAQPLVVNSNLTLNLYGSVALGLASADAVFQVQNDRDLYANVASQAVVVTSIDIAATRVLTCKANLNNTCTIRMHRDFRSAGSVIGAVLPDGVSRAGVDLTASSFNGLVGSSIVTTGLAGAASAGGTGGAIGIHTVGLLINQGTLTSSGGDGTLGGNAGNVVLQTYDGELFNTGAITGRGGATTAGTGGSGGGVLFTAGYRGARNSGAVDVTGGIGDTVGGQGGNVGVQPSNVGLTLNSGALTTKGGACTAGNCNGGGGGAIGFDCYGGDLRSSGNLDASGADGKGIGQGGAGNTITLSEQDGLGPEGNSALIPTGSVTVSGNLTSTGGNGGGGRQGGAVSILLDTANLPQGQELTLLGYTDFISNGGTATNGTGGSAGQLLISSTASTWQGAITGPSGAVLNQANVSARGADGTFGGNGGTLLMRTRVTSTLTQVAEVVDNQATTVDLRGGVSTSNGAGFGGSLVMHGIMGVTNAAAVNGTGGTASGGPSGGGGGGNVLIKGYFGPTSNTGALTLNGGSGTSTAGNGGNVLLHGKTVSNTAAISCNGANATTIGGQGGIIDVLSAPPGTSTVTGAMSVTPGNGTVPGKKGTIAVDGVDVTP